MPTHIFAADNEKLSGITLLYIAGRYFAVNGIGSGQIALHLNLITHKGCTFTCSIDI
jgi:homogentisate 1,2-dioxygenase